MLRTADLVLILVDAQTPSHHQALLKEVYAADIRINKKKPDIVVTKKERGGVSVSSLVRLTKIDKHTIEGIAKMFKLINADILFRDDVTVDQFIDILEANKVYTKSLTVINKIDLVSQEDLVKIKSELKPDLLISAQNNVGIDELKEAIYKKLDVISIFLKEVGKKADMKEPLIMFRGCRIRDVCEKLHKDFVSNFKFARVWGNSVKFDGQQFKKMDKVLLDGDVLELHIR